MDAVGLRDDLVSFGQPVDLRPVGQEVLKLCNVAGHVVAAQMHHRPAVGLENGEVFELDGHG